MESVELNKKYFELLKESMVESFEELGIESSFYITEQLKLDSEKIDYDNINENAAPLLKGHRVDSIRALYRQNQQRMDQEIRELINKTSPNFIMLMHQTRHTDYYGSMGFKTNEISAFEIRIYDSDDQLIWKRYQEVPGYIKWKNTAKYSHKELFKALKKDQLI